MAIVCHCNVVRERTIVKAIRRGAETVADVKAVCGAGTSCGGCEDALCRLVDEHAGYATSVVSVSGSFAAQ
ncbi:MAG: (2Fe-2S)-binding protein [Actinomycetota bacterium]|nr:(2Fe-2S)-binding protein [Actinomycetota bacterium]